MSTLRLLAEYDSSVPRFRDEELLAAFGRAVRVARTRRNWTQAELAERASPPIMRARLGSIEMGKRDPGLTLVARIAGALGMSVSQLLNAMDVELRAERARQAPEEP